LGKARIQIGVS